MTPEDISAETDAPPTVRRPRLCVISTVVVAVSVPVVATAIWYAAREGRRIGPPCSQRGPWDCLLDEATIFWLSLLVGCFVLALSLVIVYTSLWFPRLAITANAILTIGWIAMTTSIVIANLRGPTY